MSVEKKAVPSAAPDLDVSWHALTTEQVIKQLHTQLHEGLTTPEVEKRQAQYGLNQLAEKPRPGFFKLVLEQLKSFVVILLIVAGLISGLLGEWVDAGAIFAIVLLNAILGVVQESRAEESLAALKKLAAPEAQVIRDGTRKSVPARELVPGDVVLLEAGNYIPADVRLVEAVNLRVEEAALTGESVPVQKNAALSLEKEIPLGDRKNSAFMGTLVSNGRGRGVVTSTGMHTQLGLIANMLQNVEEEQTPLQKKLDDLGKLLGIGALIVCGLVFLLSFVQAANAEGLASLFTTEPGLQRLVDMFMVAVSLAIAAVPEGLAAVVTISLALGMREMVRRHALIRRLASVETLGSATVICSDKTGTLTQNEMTVTRLWVDGLDFEVTGHGYDPTGEFRLDGKKVEHGTYPGALTALWVGVLNNDAQLERVQNDDGSTSYRMIGDPTEGAILVAAAKAGVFAPELNEAYPRANEIPFDSTLKRMITIHAIQQPRAEDAGPLENDQHREWYVVAVKGAPDVVLNLCTHYQTRDDQSKPLDETTRAAILAANDRMTGNALRVLGLAYRLVPALPEEINNQNMEQDLVFVGLVGMIDPARKEVTPAMQRAKSAGIRTIMITGDYPNTAKAIAETIGLLRPGHKVHTGHEIDAMDDETLRREIEITDVFARVSPEHKMRIVDALKADGEVTAMTGDGVNDAPAIKRADIGVAMGITGTDVAKETADMVLTDDNYASIVAAIEQGRVIYSNIRKFVYYLISCNMAEIMIIFLGTLITGVSPLAAIQLLWLNLVTDGAPALALATEKGDPDIMNQPPRPAGESIINKQMRIGIVVQTVAITAVVLGAYFIGLASDAHIEFAETMAFATLSISELFRAYTARSEYYPLLKIGLFGNKWMNWAVLSSLAMILLVIYIPFLNTIFKTVPLGWAQWLEILPLLLVPSVAAELTKYFLGRRQRVAQA